MTFSADRPRRPGKSPAYAAATSVPYETGMDVALREAHLRKEIAGFSQLVPTYLAGDTYNRRFHINTVVARMIERWAHRGSDGLSEASFAEFYERWKRTMADVVAIIPLVVNRSLKTGGPRDPAAALREAFPDGSRQVDPVDALEEALRLQILATIDRNEAEGTEERTHWPPVNDYDNLYDLLTSGDTYALPLRGHELYRVARDAAAAVVRRRRPGEARETPWPREENPGMTRAEALAEARRRWGPMATVNCSLVYGKASKMFSVLRPDPVIRYMLEAVGFGNSYEAAFADADRRAR